MFKKTATIFLFLFILLKAKSQQVEKGVSHNLAEQRYTHISKLVYKLSFDVPADKAEKIAASAEITFELKDTLQSLQLDFRQDSSHVHSITANDKKITISVQNEHLIVPSQYLRKGQNRLSIDFIAGNESLNRNSDYLYALFVPDRARTVFPCFDQPDLKANFILTLTVPAGWNVLANASIKDSSTVAEKAVYHFNQSDKLPTYLFSFTAGKYSVADKMNMRFLFRETDITKIRLSVDSVFLAHRNAITFLQEWTGISFPFQKIGFVGIPSFQFGGMEHPGEVQYNAQGLFLDDGATKDQLIARSNVISHETAHMWFGDMVTMKWFNDVWMKEVFANFMADKVTKKLMGQETFDLKFLLDHTPAAYNVDRTPGANPIRQQLDNLQDAGSLYGNIIYHKAPVMMRQLELLMHPDNFRKGVQEYLQQYKYSNARWDDLIAILGRHTKENLVKWNEVWVNRPGRPVFNYQINGNRLVITQKAEQGTPAIWPEQFAITLLYPDSSKTIQLNMKNATISIPLSTKPEAVLFNSDGFGYGLFPAFVNYDIFLLKNPVQRAAAYINAYENMLAARFIKADSLLSFFTAGLQNETSELNLRLICGYMGTVYWNFTPPTQRIRWSAVLENAIWNALILQSAFNNKKILFKAYQDLATSTEAGKRLYEIWQSQKPPDGVKLTEDDYTALALSIAVKTDTLNDVVQQQLQRVTNADRKARLQFLAPAVSADSSERDRFFISLQNISNRRKEAWVIVGLSYLNHPLRQKTFMKFLPASLEMLQEVQRTGDVFFPQNWLGAIFSDYQTREAWQVVEHFVNSNPGYNPKLGAKILQSTDMLFRAQKVNSN